MKISSHHYLRISVIAHECCVLVIMITLSNNQNYQAPHYAVFSGLILQCKAGFRVKGQVSQIRLSLSSASADFLAFDPEDESYISLRNFEH
jgi:hypothetical protein